MTQPPPPGTPPPPGGYQPPGGQPPPPGNYQPAPPPGNYQPPPGNYQPPGGYQAPPPGPYGAPPEPPSKNRSGCLIAFLIIGGLGLLGVIGVIALVAATANSVENTIEQITEATVPDVDDADVADIDDADTAEPAPQDEAAQPPEPDAEPAVEPEPDAEPDDAPAGGDEANDVGPCVVVDENTVLLDVTNNSSGLSNYIIDVNFLDGSGQRIADESFFMNNLRPNERALEPSFAFSLEGAAACEIANVDRFESFADGDVSEVTCDITGLDFADDIETALVATNGSSELSDYSIDFAIIRDGVRVGVGFGFIENVRAGESAPGVGFTTVDGPVEGATCDVVGVTRFAS